MPQAHDFDSDSDYDDMPALAGTDSDSESDSDSETESEPDSLGRLLPFFSGSDGKLVMDGHTSHRAMDELTIAFRSSQEYSAFVCAYDNVT